MSVKRDYKPESTWKKGRRRVRLHGLIVMVLVLVALVGSLMAYFGGDDEETPPLVSLPAPSEPQQTQEVRSIPLPEKPKPKYEFYTELPKRQIEISKDELDQGISKAPPPKPTPATSPPPAQPKARSEEPAVSRDTSRKTGRYVIQAGSFRSHAQADRLKATLALLGINAHIEIGTGRNDARWHRIRIGPLNDPQEVQAIRRRLQENNIPSIAIKTN